MIPIKDFITNETCTKSGNLPSRK